jgi:ABC-type multidrug transport system fused ATPase/permease subunit
MSNVNFIEFITPITRISVSCYVLFFDLITVLIPTAAFLLGISLYFLYKNVVLGSMFLIGNIIALCYAIYFWSDMSTAKNYQETKINENEKYIVDILNNIDKVIYRGQTTIEIDSFAEKTDASIDVANKYMSFVTTHTTCMGAIIYITIFSSLAYLIKLRTEKKVDNTIFITFFTIILLYRDRILGTIQNIPDYLEFIGRLDYIIEEFNRMLGSRNDINAILDKTYDGHELPFDHIKFTDVSFKYESGDRNIMEDFNMDLYLNDKIIGITGLSGKGKSSFVKMILRLYDCTDGVITIDGVDIKTIDPNYIRTNITYVNQNSKLFDKKVIENIMYGCNDLDACNESLIEIMKYSKIQELYKNVDIHNMQSGSLGENLSGGQRQVINIISGLINPSKILILDEPTNALDPELKQEILHILSKFRKYKKAILIITHDKDVHTLFDETIKI